MTTIVDPQNLGAQTKTPEADGGASLEKVRDLLFGVQMRDYDRKFARLEERLVKETNDLRDEVRKRLASLEQLLAKEAESLNERIRSEQQDRTTKTAQIDDQLARGLREVRQQIHEQHQQLSDELKRQADEILERLARESHELRTDKTDRASLAALLTEMAMRLTDDFRLPASEDASRA